MLAVTAVANMRSLRALTTRMGDGWTRLHPEVKKRAIAVLNDAHAAGLPVGVFEGVRSRERSLENIANGTTKITDPDASLHRWGLAVDFVFLDPLGRWTWNRPRADWNALGAIIKKHGFFWGGDFKSFFDGPHAELRLYSLSHLKAMGAPETIKYA